LRSLRTQVVLLLAIALALPAAAVANDFQNVYREYKRTGTIKPCLFTDKQLAGAEKQTPPDVEQYAPSFLDALQTARERNADCGKKQAAAPAAVATPTTPTTPPAPPTASTPTPTPATNTAPAATAPPPAPPNPAQPKVAGVPSPPIERVSKEDTAPAAVWLLATLGALALLSAVFAGLAWWLGWSAEWFTRPWHASWGDFGGRASDLGVELRDWLRTGE
jgi:outer membrane biosynthesis protein TonB